MGDGKPIRSCPAGHSHTPRTASGPGSVPSPRPLPGGCPSDTRMEANICPARCPAVLHRRAKPWKEDSLGTSFVSVCLLHRELSTQPDSTAHPSRREAARTLLLRSHQLGAAAGGRSSLPGQKEEAARADGLAAGRAARAAGRVRRRTGSHPGPRSQGDRREKWQLSLILNDCASRCPAQSDRLAVPSSPSLASVPSKCGMRESHPILCHPRFLLSQFSHIMVTTLLVARLGSSCGTLGLFPLGLFVYLHFPYLLFTAGNLIPDLGTLFKEESCGLCYSVIWYCGP